MNLKVVLNKNINLGFLTWLLGFTVISLWNLGYIAQMDNRLLSPYMPYIGITLVIGIITIMFEFQRTNSMINKATQMTDKQRCIADFIAGYNEGYRMAKNETRHIRKTIPNKKTDKKPPTKK